MITKKPVITRVPTRIIVSPPKEFIVGTNVPEWDSLIEKINKYECARVPYRLLPKECPTYSDVLITLFDAMSASDKCNNGMKQLEMWRLENVPMD